MNEDLHNTTMSLTIDELRWLQFSRVMDLPSRSSSPLPVFQHSQCELSQSHDAFTLHNHNPKLSHGSNTSFHLRSSLDPMSKSQHKSTSMSIGAESSFGGSGLSSSNLSRSLPSGSSCQEWIYRRPNKTTGHAQLPRQAIPIRSRVRPPHSMDQGKKVPKQLVIETSDDELNAIPFWSTLLRSRSRSDRSVPSLKARPSRAQLVISRPFTPLPTISSGPNETTLISTTKHLPLRTPSITSTASTASTSSTRLGTPTKPSFSRNTNRHRRNGTLRPLESFTSQHAKPEIDYPSLSSSCPPSKSILASVSTKGSHTPSATSGAPQNKSVKFVDIPTVHYASPAGWHSLSMNEIGKIGAGQRGNDAHLGIDVEGMDIDRDLHLRGSEAKELCHSSERAIEVLCCTPTPEKERATALKRLVSLKHSAAIERGRNILSTASRRPTISGPYALGTVQSMSTNDTASSILPLSLSQQNKEPSLSLSSAADSDQNRLRNAPSLESVKSTRSIGARSMFSLGSTKGAASIRGFRTWIETNIAPNIRLNFGSGWSFT
ncbi:hypothetical protein APHAL10511_006179 [Amanita phalloides]|nr:hypothetical protein APHAL10511_006179 [Amanita phalloides]